MSHPSFIGILVLCVGLAVLAGLMLWYNERLKDLESQVTRHRLQLKVLTSKEPLPAADAPVVPTLPEEKPPSSGAKRSSSYLPVPNPATQNQTAQAMPARCQVIEPVEESVGMDNRAIDKGCSSRSLSMDALPEPWRCTDGRPR